jgi:hypothetical protein
MYKVVLGFIFFSCFVTANSELDKVLDSFHQAAAEANYEEYLGLLAQDAIYLGTDSTERWNKSEFAAFVKPYFSQGRGWLYTPVKRHITQSQASNIAFFDELLDNKSYGRCRGSGVLVNTEQGWKILQYNLSIPIPNAIARQVVDVIQTHRASGNK